MKLPPALVALFALTLSASAETILLDEALVLERVGRYGRNPVPVDPILVALAEGSMTPPREGDTVIGADGTERTWTAQTAAENGSFGGPAMRGGWASFTVDLDHPRAMVLQCSGHRVAYVNGMPRGGDPYSTGWPRIPVDLHAGTNHILIQGARGAINARLLDPPAPVFISPTDRTMPDLLVDEDHGARGAVIVVNTTNERLEDLVIAAGGDGMPTRETRLPAIEPMSSRKVPFWFGGAVAPDTRSVRTHLDLIRWSEDGQRQRLHHTAVNAAVRRAEETHKRTFISAIDGSVQYYGVTPARTDGTPDVDPGLILTLHGASVEGIGQARVYGRKDWAHVVAPTNRRPYGFDWEDWGRLDALEVLDLVTDRLDIDESRTFLTGHSMGGHGTWHLGVTFPDQWAAIGPSAGWVSFWSYTGAQRIDDEPGIESVMRRATTGSDTVALSRNYLHHGIYILHGDADNNVPVDQARFMREHLTDYHDDWAYHEQPGAGHWWGNQCCDWPAMMDFFKPRRRPTHRDVDHIEFVTASPGISSSSYWASIEAQRRWMSPSRVVLDLDRAARRITGTTDNVTRLALSLDHLEGEGTVTIQLDDQPAVTVDAGATVVRLARGAGSARAEVSLDDARWTVLGDDAIGDELKGPHRAGPFKDAFRHRMMFVYGTQGSDAEDAWAAAKARFDAETFWYRGNGAVDVMPDHAFDPAAHAGRGIILYGNADTNSAWNTLLADSPVQVHRDAVIIGKTRLNGDDLACLLIRPRTDPHAGTACVGVVAGTGLTGCRVTDPLPYFVSGVGYPDCVVLGAEALRDGVAGVRAAGYFGGDWSVQHGDFSFRDRP